MLIFGNNIQNHLKMQFLRLARRLIIGQKKTSMRYIIFLFLSCSTFFAKAQTPDTPTEKIVRSEIQILEDTLNILGFAMVNDSTPVKRFASCQKFIKTLVKALKNENSFDYPFEKINTVSIQYAPDSSFRIFTWQLYVDINEYKYFGTMQMNQPELKMFPLIDRFIDVLTFGKNGEPTFGAVPLFEAEDSTNVNRFILEYGSDARVQLNWNDELQMIVFDHLVEAPSAYPGQQFMYIPDGDVDGLKLEDGKWKYVRRIFDQVLEEAPRPEPVFNEKGGSRKGKDLFGNKRN